jgi:hypothetical protein
MFILVWILAIVAALFIPVINLLGYDFNFEFEKR